MSRPVDGLERELGLDEQMKWGTCPVCQAEHGEHCHAAVGLQLGQKVDGSRMQTGEGVHLARLRNAPARVREVAIE